MRKRSKAFASSVGLVAAVSVIAACSSGSSSSARSSNSGSTSLSSGTQGLNPGSGSPKSGGTLNMLGKGDVDYMDPNISYYSIGYLGQRPWIRGLYAYPATPGHTTSPAPDLATATPVISNGGKTYTITLRTGAMWDTSPARQVTDGRCRPRDQALVQPGPAVRRPARLRVADRRVRAVLQRLRQRGPHHCRDQVLHRRAPDLRRHPLPPDPHLQPDPPGVLLPLHADAARLQPRAGRVSAVPAGQCAVPAAPHRRRPVHSAELHPRPAHHLRAEPGVEGEHGPDPQGLRRQDRRHRDGQPADHPAAAADQHGQREHGLDSFPPLAAVPGLSPRCSRPRTTTSTWARRTQPNPSSPSTRSRRTTAARCPRWPSGRR